MIPITEVESKLRTAIAVVMAEGWKLKQRCTFDPTSKCCCPLGALAFVNDIPIADGDESSITPLERYLGVDRLGIFVFGFDALKPSLAPGCHPLYLLGVRLAKEFAEAT